MLKLKLMNWGADMSDYREPDIILIKKVPKNQGKKTYIKCKIELFAASQFEQNWKPCDTRFDPPVPLETKARKRYFTKRHYRVRVDGRWL